MRITRSTFKTKSVQTNDNRTKTSEIGFPMKVRRHMQSKKDNEKDVSTEQHRKESSALTQILQNKSRKIRLTNFFYFIIPLGMNIIESYIYLNGNRGRLFNSLVSSYLRHWCTTYLMQSCEFNHKNHITHKITSSYVINNLSMFNIELKQTNDCL